jgi:hypothetical protein
VTVGAVEVSVALVCDRSRCVSIGGSKVIAGGCAGVVGAIER